MSATQQSKILKWDEIESSIYNAPLFDSLQIPDSIRQIIAEFSFDWNWDPSMTFGISLSKDKTEIHHHPQNRIVHSPLGWQTTRGNLCLDDAKGYIYEWDIEAKKLTPTGDIVIGILSDDGSRPDPENNEEDRNEGFMDNAEMWAYHSTNEYHKGGYTVHLQSTRRLGGGVDHDKELNVQFGVSDVITTIYNSKLKTLSFKKNGNNVIEMKGQSRVIYAGIKGDIFPFVTIYDIEDKAALLDIRYY